jgi:tellurite resistance-related uncharacterized protein
MTVCDLRIPFLFRLTVSSKLLNTFANMGGTWPKWFILKGMCTFLHLGNVVTKVTDRCGLLHCGIM